MFETEVMMTTFDAIMVLDVYSRIRARIENERIDDDHWVMVNVRDGVTINNDNDYYSLVPTRGSGMSVVELLGLPTHFDFHLNDADGSPWLTFITAVKEATTDVMMTLDPFTAPTLALSDSNALYNPEIADMYHVVMDLEDEFGAGNVTSAMLRSRLAERGYPNILEG